MGKNCATISFRVRESKHNKNGLSPIEAQISYNSTVSRFNTGKHIDCSYWSKTRQIASQKCLDAEEINCYLLELQKKLFRIETALMDKGVALNASILRDALFDRVPMLTGDALLVFIKQSIDTKKGLAGKCLSQSTFYCYEHTYTLLQDYINGKLHRQDVSIQEVNMMFIQGWHSYLLLRMSQNTAVKHLNQLKSWMDYAVANGCVNTNKIHLYKVRRTPVDIAYLDRNELDRFRTFESDKSNLMVARDMFLFGCYTGLSYGDIITLGVEHLYFDKERRLWIKKKRIKTGVLSRVPVLPPAKEIILKYAANEFRLAPYQDLSDLNKNIKKIAEACNIGKKVTFHTSRHTFATTVALANHLSIEVVSNMMGHTNTRMTEHYARVIDDSIAEEMSGLIGKV